MAQKSSPSRTKPVRKAPTPTASECRLDQKFWGHFSKNIWEKKPLHLKNVKSPLLEMSDAEIFDLLVLYADRCRQLNDPEGFKFYVDGFKAEPEEVLQVLPEQTDKSLLGYHKRMESQFEDYCLVCDELLQVNLKKQHLLTDFTDELYRHVGFPNRFSEMGLYLGNYRQTPFGVHVDSCGVFSFPVAGKKKFRLWSAAYGDKHPELDRAFEYNKHKKHSQVLEASPGDIAYWPSSEWHIAESDGSFSATWSLGVWVNQPHKDVFSNSLKTLLDEKLGASGAKFMTEFKTLHSKSGEVAELPKAYRQSLDLLKKLNPLELEEIFLKDWMKHLSLQGFKTMPRSDLKLSLKSEIQLRSERFPVLWQQSLTNKKNFFLSYGGTLAESSSSALLKLVTELNAGESCVLSSYLKGSNQKKDLQALQALANAGGFKK